MDSSPRSATYPERESGLLRVIASYTPCATDRVRLKVPISWVFAYVGAYSRNDGSVEPLDLPMSLGMIGCRELVMNVQDTTDVEEKLRRELFAIVGNQVEVQRPVGVHAQSSPCLLYTSPSPRDQRGSRMPSSA